MGDSSLDIWLERLYSYVDLYFLYYARSQFHCLNLSLFTYIIWIAIAEHPNLKFSLNQIKHIRHQRRGVVYLLHVN